MAKEQDNLPLSEETDVSLGLALSLGLSTATAKGKQVVVDYNFEAGENNYGNAVQYQRQEHDKIKDLGKKKTESLSLVAMNDFLGFLSKGKSPATDLGEVRQENLKVGAERYNLYDNNLMPKLGYGDYSCSTSRKRKRMANPSTSKNNKELVSTELRLGPDPWRIKKKLTKSDLGNNSRLLVSRELLQEHVFPFWNRDKQEIKEGFPVSVWDTNTKTEHELVFKQWNEQANAFKKNWVKDFVKRRNLKLNDEIGLYWDQGSSRFNFSVLNKELQVEESH